MKKAELSRHTVKDSNEICIRCLKNVARNWGGDIIELPENIFRFIRDAQPGRWANAKFAESPFSSNLGLFFKEKIVIYCGEVFWPDIIHEMGHIFAVESMGSEEEKFFGWEYALSRFIAGPRDFWLECMSDYQINHPLERIVKPFSKFTDKEKDEIIKHHVELCRQSGLIVDNVPVAVR